MWYTFWIIFVFATSGLSAFISKRANDTKLWTWVFFGYLMGPCGVWPLVAKYSKDLVFDAFLYDAIVLAGFFTTLWFIGVEKFGTWHWIGSSMMLLGLILFKVK